MTTDQIKTPGLRWRNGRPIWRASRAAIMAGYPVKSANLTHLANDIDTLVERCARLNREQRDWTLDRSNRARERKFSGTIYVVRAGDLLKIGFTTDVQRRLCKLESGSPVALDLLATFPGTPDVEKFLHWMFRQCRERAEWFRPDDFMMQVLQTYILTGTPQNIPRKRAPRHLRAGARRTPRSRLSNDISDDPGREIGQG